MAFDPGAPYSSSMDDVPLRLLFGIANIKKKSNKLESKKRKFIELSTPTNSIAVVDPSRNTLKKSLLPLVEMIFQNNGINIKEHQSLYDGMHDKNYRKRAKLESKLGKCKVSWGPVPKRPRSKGAKMENIEDNVGEKLSEIEISNQMENLVAQFESAIFKLHGNSKKYREKARYVIRKLKGSINAKLCHCLWSGKITPELVCNMTRKQLLSFDFSECLAVKDDQYADVKVKQTADHQQRTFISTDVDNVEISKDSITASYSSFPRANKDFQVKTGDSACMSAKQLASFDSHRSVNDEVHTDMEISEPAYHQVSTTLSTNATAVEPNKELICNTASKQLASFDLSECVAVNDERYAEMEVLQAVDRQGKAFTIPRAINVEQTEDPITAAHSSSPRVDNDAQNKAADGPVMNVTLLTSFGLGECRKNDECSHMKGSESSHDQERKLMNATVDVELNQACLNSEIVHNYEQVEAGDDACMTAKQRASSDLCKTLVTKDEEYANMEILETADYQLKTDTSIEVTDEENEHQKKTVALNSQRVDNYVEVKEADGADMTSKQLASVDSSQYSVSQTSAHQELTLTDMAVNDDRLSPSYSSSPNADDHIQTKADDGVCLKENMISQPVFDTQDISTSCISAEDQLAFLGQESGVTGASLTDDQVLNLHAANDNLPTTVSAGESVTEDMLVPDAKQDKKDNTDPADEQLKDSDSDKLRSDSDDLNTDPSSYLSEKITGSNSEIDTVEEMSCDIAVILPGRLAEQDIIDNLRSAYDSLKDIDFSKSNDPGHSYNNRTGHLPERIANASVDNSVTPQEVLIESAASLPVPEAKQDEVDKVENAYENLKEKNADISIYDQGYLDTNTVHQIPEKITSVCVGGSVTQEDKLGGGTQILPGSEAKEDKPNMPLCAHEHVNENDSNQLRHNPGDLYVHPEISVAGKITKLEVEEQNKKHSDSSSKMVLVSKDASENKLVFSCKIQEFKDEKDSNILPEVKLWEGCLQLNSSASAMVTALFKSGVKVQTKNWTKVVEIKGRVRLDAFDKFLQELPLSRNRSLMVVSFRCTPGAPESGLIAMHETCNSYKQGERVGYAELCPGVDLYVCPPSELILNMLLEYGFCKSIHNKIKHEDLLIGCVIWRRNNRPSSSTTTSSSNSRKTDTQLKSGRIVSHSMTGPYTEGNLDDARMSPIHPSQVQSQPQGKPSMAMATQLYTLPSSRIQRPVSPFPEHKDSSSACSTPQTHLPNTGIVNKREPVSDSKASTSYHHEEAAAKFHNHQSSEKPVTVNAVKLALAGQLLDSPTRDDVTNSRGSDTTVAPTTCDIVFQAKDAKKLALAGKLLDSPTHSPEYHSYRSVPNLHLHPQDRIASPYANDSNPCTIANHSSHTMQSPSSSVAVNNDAANCPRMSSFFPVTNTSSGSCLLRNTAAAPCNPRTPDHHHINQNVPITSAAAAANSCSIPVINSPVLGLQRTPGSCDHDAAAPAAPSMFNAILNHGNQNIPTTATGAAYVSVPSSKVVVSNSASSLQNVQQNSSHYNDDDLPEFDFSSAVSAAVTEAASVIINAQNERERAMARRKNLWDDDNDIPEYCWCPPPKLPPGPPTNNVLPLATPPTFSVPVRPYVKPDFTPVKQGQHQHP